MSDAPTKLVREKQNEGRLLLVSNRLPITIKRSDEGKFEMSMSSGGLVSGLSGLSKTTTFQWYGWPGLEVPEDEVSTLTTQLKDEYNAVPIMLDDELADRHYNGFSSKLVHPQCLSAMLILSHRRHHVAPFPLPPR
jgi:trehalose 6-phosphate synthase